MSSHQPEQDISLSKDQAAPWISPMSSMDFDEQGEASQRMSSISSHLGYSQLNHDSQHHHTGHTTEQGDASDSSTQDQRSSSRYSATYDNPLRLSHQSSRFKIRRVPVPEREVSFTSESSIRDLITTESTSQMSSPGDTLIGGSSPPRSSRWGRLWSNVSSLHRKKSSIDTLTMDMQPISGTECHSIMEEGGCDGNSTGAYYPKQCCSDGPEPCSSKKDIQSPASHWLTKVVIFLSLYSTVMSGIWLFVAIVQPRWGRRISSRMGMGPSTATVLTAFLSKTIELSFVTTFITFLGQILSRRAISQGSRGTTLAEMSMRSWVIQPGSLATHSGMLRFAGFSILGILSLLATLVAAFYTTASDAMVAPKLKYGHWEHKPMSGYVRSSYANSDYVKLLCPDILEPEVGGNDNTIACTAVIISGESYRNLQNFMGIWNTINTNGTTLIHDIKHRPAGVASLNGNTTLYGSWIETEHSDVAAHFEKTGRIINNVTLAMPHPGVAAAATSPLNGILQPEDLSGLGEYAVKAGVVSPAVNVLCVNMAQDELKPLVYTEWPNAKTNWTGVGLQKQGWQNWTDEVPKHPDSRGNDNYFNRTVVDDIFHWGPTYQRRPPVFQLFPADYNTVVNSTVIGSDAIYIMGKHPQSQNYTMCELRSWVSPNCSTQFNISGISGSKMAAHCEDPDDVDSYRRSFPGPQKWALPSNDWKWLADQWRLATDLNGGERNNNASNARILTQLILLEPELLSYQPSMAEALAVFASSMLTLGAVGTPFRHYWEYEKPRNILGEPGIVHQFNASVITQQYTSGHVYNWQGIFYVILALMFALNVVCCAYIFLHAKLVTDYTEAHNLFALALNSSPNERLKGTCGGGPQERDLAVPWRVGYSSGANHYFIEQTGGGPWERTVDAKTATSKAANGDGFAGESYDRLRNGRPWL
ncbi:hypothetical protein LEL_03345 [Akanthomyces lecanii RCEF 1005]|uniref:Mcm2 3 5 family protein n=1 Tax=Akanthomyces lecanii RCEF 1005 TaxID=1081108 RepID=A0A168IZV3_CORDF|nr:hypothetical protein LEL_03345 [Akanthomyces lecanii RCEF 1005]